LTGEEAVAQLRAELRADQRTEDLAESMDRVEEEVQAWWTVVHLPWFTDHSPSHSRRVADYALRLADIPSLRDDVRLKPLERYILYVAAWLHDLGMNDLELSPRPLGEMTPKDFESIRHEHPERTKVRLLEREGLFGLPAGDPVLAEVVAFTARAHGTLYYEDSVRVLKEKMRVRNEVVRGPLLAALLLIADEIDLHYERARPLPGGAALPPISEAHAFKHRCVTWVNPTLSSDGGIGVAIQLTFPSEMSGDDRLDVERWITVKLQQQMGLVERELRDGFSRQVWLNRAITVTYGTPHTVRPSLSSAGMAIVRAETIQDQLIDHRRALRQILAALDAGNIVIVNGNWVTDEERDVDGREDLLSTAVARCRAIGQTVLSSARLRLNGAGSLSDVLEEWLGSLPTASPDDMLQNSERDGVESSRVKELANELTDQLKGLQPSRVLFAASRIDGLTSAEKVELTATLIPTLQAAAPTSAFLFSAEPGSTFAAEIPIIAIAAGSLDRDDVLRYMGRYVEPDAALGSSMAELDYAAYRSIAQGYERALRALVTA
jgi:hypothetical protein